MDPINPIAGNPEALNSNPQTPEVAKDSHGITVVALAIFIVLSLAAVAFLYYQNQQLKSMLAGYQQIQNTPNPIASQTPSVDMSKWKKYTDPKNSFSLLYPDSLQLKVFNDKSLILTGVDGNEKVTHEFRVSPYILPTNTTLYQFVYDGGLGDNYGKSYIDGNKVTLTFKDVSQNSLNKVWEPSEWPSANGILIKFIQNKNLLISFSLEPYNPGGTPIPYEKEYIELFNQILSTFEIGTTGSPSASPVACTLEAKICPDGSSVGRTGPKCEFAPCPTP